MKLRELFIVDNNIESLISFETFSEESKISLIVVWECFLALKFEPQKLDEQIYFSAQNLKRVEQFIKRIEISWACPNILESCCRRPHQ